MVKAEQAVRISELAASAQVKRSAGEAESLRLRATGESEAIQIVGERIVPDVSVTNGHGGDGLVAALLGSLMRERTAGVPPAGK